jgi:hypothetical protein
MLFIIDSVLHFHAYGNNGIKYGNFFMVTVL